MNSTYRFERLTCANQEAACAIYQQNLAYFSLTKEVPTLATVIADSHARPPQVAKEQKYFGLVWDEEQPVAVIDLLTGYPEATSSYLGLLLVAKHRQAHGRRILIELEEWLYSQGFRQMALGVLEQNLEALAFWTAQGFRPQGTGSVTLATGVFPVVKFAKDLLPTKKAPGN